MVYLIWATNDQHHANLLPDNDVAATVANATVKKIIHYKRTPKFSMKVRLTHANAVVY